MKHFRHYLQGPKFRIRTDHAPLRSVLKAKEPEGQLARWIELLSTFTYEMEYREGKHHQNADTMSRRPCSEGCKWCKEWRKPEKRASVAAQTDGAIEADIKVSQIDLVKEITSPVTVEHLPCNTRPTATCKTVKLEPVWTRKYLHEQQAADPDLKVMLHLKQTNSDRPPWEEVSPYSRVVKVLWAQWERLEIHDQVLCRRWEEENGSKLPYTYQIILPVTLQKIAFDAHHSHTTASHRGVTKTLHALRTRYYWPGQTSQVKRWVGMCHDCGAKKVCGRKRRSPLKQYLVRARWSALRWTFWDPYPRLPVETDLC